MQTAPKKSINTVVSSSEATKRSGIDVRKRTITSFFCVSIAAYQYRCALHTFFIPSTHTHISQDSSLICSLGETRHTRSHTNTHTHIHHYIMSGSSALTDNSAQQLITKVNVNIQNIRQAADGVSRDTIASLEQDLNRLENYVKNLQTHATNVYDNIDAVKDAPDIGLELAEARQRFETSTHLAKQSREAYLRERKFMWLWVVLALVLGGCFVYMYIWTAGLGAASGTTPADHSIISVPDKRELLDSNVMEPSALFEDDEGDEGDENDPTENKDVAKIRRRLSRMFSRPKEHASTAEGGASFMDKLEDSLPGSQGPAAEEKGLFDD